MLVFAFLARLLDKSAFGIVAFASALAIGSEILVKGGFAQALIQRRDLRDSHTHAAFWVSNGIAALVAAVIVLAAPFITSDSQDPQTVLVIQVLSVRLFLVALGEVPRALLMRRFRFRLIAIRTVAGVLAGGAAGVALALAGAGVWSLVAQIMVQSAIASLTMFWGVDWRPALRFEPSAARDLFGFGLGVVGQQGLDFLARTSDVFAVGWILGSVALGVYTVGQRVVLLAIGLLVRAPLQILLPTLARKQDDPALLRRGFLKAAEFSLMIVTPGFVLMSLLAEEIVMVAFGARWAESVDVLAALAIYGLVSGIVILTNQGLLAAGRSGHAAALASLDFVAGVAALVVWTSAGTTATAVAFTVASVAVLPARVVAVRAALGFTWAEAGRIIRIPIAGGLGMVGAMYVLREVMQRGPVLTGLATTLSGGIVFVAIATLIDRTAIRRMVLTLVPRRRAQSSPQNG